MSCHRTDKRRKSAIIVRFSVIAMTLPFAQYLLADDVACSASGGSSNVDFRPLPSTPGDTVLNGRQDGSPDSCIIFSRNTGAVDYPNGLTINTQGTGIAFRGAGFAIGNGLTVDDSNNGAGLVTIRADNITKISGSVNIVNQGKLRFNPKNTVSSSTRLNLKDAYISVEAGSELQLEYDLGDSTGDYIPIGALQGAGNTRLTNVDNRSSTASASLFIENGDGGDYTYSGDIIYDNQIYPEIGKRGAGTFTFLGDVNKATGDSLGFTDGFGVIDIREGAFQTTTEAFVYGTVVRLDGGDLIFNQNTDGVLTGATFTGKSDIYKRGSGSVTLQAISTLFTGNMFIDSGQIALTGSASLANASNININNGATLDLSGSTRSSPLSRLSGSGTLALGGHSVQKIVHIAPGTNSIGVFNVTGSGNLSLDGTLLQMELDPTQAAGDAPGVTHDQLNVQGSVSTGLYQGISLTDKQNAASVSEFLGGREFTVATAGSGLSGFTPSMIIEDTASFHAFVGADPEATIITDTEIKVKFGIKTAQQVATTVSTAIVSTPSGTSSGGSTNNKNNAAQQYIQSTLGLSGNQKPTEAQLNSISGLNNLTTNQLARAVSNNNPEAYSSNLTLNLEYADLIANMVMDHANGSGIAMQALDDEQVRNGRVWMNASYVDGKVEGTQNKTGGFGYDLSGIVIGSDLIKNEKHTMGLFAGVGITDMDEHDHIDQSFDGNMFQAGLYHQYRFANDYSLNSMVSVLYGDYDTVRKNYDTAGGYGPQSKASFSSYGGMLGANIAKSFSLDEATSVTPSAGLTYTHIRQNDIKESQGGTAYDYSIDSADADAIVLGIGADLTHSIGLEGSIVLLDFRARYEYDAYADNNDTHDIKAGLEGQQKDTFVGQNRGAHGLIVGAGVEGQIGDNMTMGGGYVYSARSEGYDSSFGANFTYFF